jgi:ankyrin repeat protein
MWLLLEKGAAVNQGKTDNGVTPLFVAAQNGHVEVVVDGIQFRKSASVGAVAGTRSSDHMLRRCRLR